MAEEEIERASPEPLKLLLNLQADPQAKNGP
jgi:hypothetical protein